MSVQKRDVLLIGNKKPVIVNGLSGAVNLYVLADASDKDAFIRSIAPKIGGFAVSDTASKIDSELMGRFPNLKIVSTFGVGYDHIDAKWAGAHGIIVTNTAEVLNEEVADTALALLLNTVREFPQAERYLRAGKWLEKPYRLSPGTLRDRTVGLVGMGRIGKAIARRLEAFLVPIVYHSRNPQPDVSYKYYSRLVDMARDVDTLMLIVPGGAATRNLINKEVLEALGPRGVLINMARGSVVDEPALIAALKDRTIMSAGLDVFVDEPRVPQELIDMNHVVLLPHVGSASVYTRTAMDQLVVDNLVAWAQDKPPLTPVAETPWRLVPPSHIQDHETISDRR